ncbi:hypothetical protein [Sandaracinus amylolyticus]|uniref:hypothetical protein n=1 Tax=Sandaracinus amylolyticus TaxID=927083 RepID=UPI001F2D98C8|nr:hypothetical protein [Sandaracinus amylolyticus]UJR82168.1 Kazal-type serine protease inhibitor domain protein [Sandaracinus amylolyticus]
MTRLCSFVALVVLALASACSESHSITGDAAVRVDAGARCGDEVCAIDEVCCPGCPGEAPLGCTPGGCPPIACPGGWTRCEDALAGGASGDPCSFGGACEADEGCCARTARCSSGALVLERECGPGCSACASSADCDAESYCDFTALGCHGPGSCMPRPSGCPEDCPGVCACDGTTHCNACIANAAGASVARPGACDAPGCEAQDARGEGACLLFLGYAWNGAACTGISGCQCIGADCDELYPSPDACSAARAGCLAD